MLHHAEPLCSVDGVLEYVPFVRMGESSVLKGPRLGERAYVCAFQCTIAVDNCGPQISPLNFFVLSVIPVSVLHATMMLALAAAVDCRAIIGFDAEVPRAREERVRCRRVVQIERAKDERRAEWWPHWVRSVADSFPRERKRTFFIGSRNSSEFEKLRGKQTSIEFVKKEKN